MKNKYKLLGFVVMAVFCTALLFTGCEDLSKEEKKEDNNGDGVTSYKTFTDVWVFRDWLGKQPDTTPDKPYKVKLNNISTFDLSSYSMGLGYEGNRKKYVYLDCSGSPFTSIGDGSEILRGFKGCGPLVGIIIPDSVTSIGNEAFSYCNNLASVTLPNKITGIGSDVFSYCDSLKSITIPDSITSIGNSAFSLSGLTSVTIGSGVTSIGTSAFAYTGLTSVTIPNGVVYLSGFNGCVGLTSITIPSSVKTIGSYAFYDCTLITSVTIPSTVTDIEAGAFGGNIGLTSVTFKGTIQGNKFIYEGMTSGSKSFPGDLRYKFYITDSTNGTPGTYTRLNTSSNEWTLQE